MVGASNFSLPELKEFAAECPLAAVQPNYNMLQRDIEAEIVPWCAENNVSIFVYWPLLKGLLAGKLARRLGAPVSDEIAFVATESGNVEPLRITVTDFPKRHIEIDLEASERAGLSISAQLLQLSNQLNRRGP